MLGDDCETVFMQCLVIDSPYEYIVIKVLAHFLIGLNQHSLFFPWYLNSKLPIVRKPNIPFKVVESQDCRCIHK